jgi:hypothetical protein
VEEDDPSLPRSVECSFELFDVLDNTEPPLGIRMFKWIDTGRNSRNLRRATRRQLEQRFRRLRREVICEHE